MTTDVRTLLHDAADAPTRTPDINGALQSARARRRRQRGFGGLAAVVAIALVVGVVALGGGGGDDPQVAVGLRQAGSDIPEGWKTVHADPGISIAIPPEWNTYDFGHTDLATPRLAVGTAPPVTADVPNCPIDASAEAFVPGSWLNVWEIPAGSVAIAGPVGDTLDVIDRPSTFALANTHSGACSDATYVEVAFRDAGRAFLARFFTTVPQDRTDERQRQLALRVLDTLRVEPIRATPVEGPTTTTTPSFPTITQLPATTSPPFVASTDDERQINDLFVAWLKDHPDDETRRIVEDADALLDSIHQGLAQHTPADLAGYSGTVSAIRMLDADHAEVQYTLLHSGQPQFGLRTGVAVRVDGNWMVSRATECALLSLGGITCPPE